MEITNRMANFKMEVKEEFVYKAERLKPVLYEEWAEPKQQVRIRRDGETYRAEPIETGCDWNQRPLGKGESICLDFGDHMVGYLSFGLEPVGSPPDAPAHIRIKFGEQPCEVGAECADYRGSISSSWIQEEFLHVDVLPGEVCLERRYAFRYVEIKVLDTSSKYRVVISHPVCRKVTSADRKMVEPFRCGDEELNRIDAIGLKTMEGCMQDVFEDGPKRDRRLWIGDLRLQALTNYETFRQNDLVKRCLYLFAGLRQNEGRVGACLFIKPQLLVDDTALFDYSLFFVSCLYDYVTATKDRQVLEDLWDTAWRQIQLAAEELDQDGVVKDRDTWWCFVDWQDQLNKQAAAQAILIYTLKQALCLAGKQKDGGRQKQIEALLDQTIHGAKTRLWDEERQFFISGREKQISWASQVWFVLADILPEQENRELLNRLRQVNPQVGMVTPYMNHYYVDALIGCGMVEEAKSHLKYYWGGMVKAGADCFWELYDPKNPNFSPYGSPVINSYCHAWSCTPSYLIRKYFRD